MLGRLSLRARLVLGVLVLAAVGLVAADVATYTSLRSFLFDRTDNTLDADHRVVEAALPDRDALRALTPGLYVQIRDSSGHVVFSSDTPRFPGEHALPPPRLPAKLDLPSAPKSGHGPDRARYFSVRAVTGSDRYRARASVDPGSNAVLIVAHPLRDVDSTLHRLLLIELLVTAIAARRESCCSASGSSASACGRWRRSGGPPPRSRPATSRSRVERAEDRTEVGRLGLALNAMLGRIEDSDRRLRRFVADASHELRTPLDRRSRVRRAVRARGRPASRRSRAGDVAGSAARASA